MQLSANNIRSPRISDYLSSDDINHQPANALKQDSTDNDPGAIEPLLFYFTTSLLTFCEDTELDSEFNSTEKQHKQT